MEEEKAAIHAEYEQERIAYQKLLKEYNTLEAANDDLKERVNMLRGGEISPQLNCCNSLIVFLSQINMKAPSAVS